MPGPAIVTGAGGFVGRHLTTALSGTQTDVIRWYRRPPDGETGPWRQVDILDHDAVRRAIAQEQPGRIYHLAGAPHVGDAWRDSLTTLQVNVLGTHHLLSAVRDVAPACRVLVITSGMIYARSDEALTENAPLVPTSPYGLSKLAQDQLARLCAVEEGLDVVVARPFNHIGPGQDPSFAASSFARQIALIEAGRRAPVLRVGNLDAERDLTDVRDVVRAYMTIMSGAGAGEAFNVCSGRTWRIGDVLTHLLAATPAAIDVEPDPDRLRPSDLPRLLGDHARLTGRFGWRPEIPLTQTLDDLLTWWRAAVAEGRADE